MFLSFLIITLALAHQPTPPTVQAERAPNPIAIAQAANRALDLYKKRDEKALLLRLARARNPVDRLSCRYALAKLSRSFLPDLIREVSHLKLQKFWLTQLGDPSTSDPVVIFPGDKEPFSYWTVYQVIYGEAKKGSAQAIKVWLNDCSGDGCYGEGWAPDIADYFDRYPDLVVRHWKLFRHQASVFQAPWRSKEDCRRLHNKYSALLQGKSSKRTAILALITRFEKDAEDPKHELTGIPEEHIE